MIKEHWRFTLDYFNQGNADISPKLQKVANQDFSWTKMVIKPLSYVRYDMV